MTEKRFEYYEHKGADYILDTPNKSLDFIEMLGDCLEAEEIVDLLNNFNDENEKLKSEIKDFQDLLTENDDVCHKRVLQLLDDKIAFFYKAKADMINIDDDYRYGQIAFAIQCLRELRKELEE